MAELEFVAEMLALEFLTKGNAGYARHVILCSRSAIAHARLHSRMLINETFVTRFGVSVRVCVSR